MKKLIYTLTFIIIALASCQPNETTSRTKMTSARGFNYTIDTINNHTFYFDNTCAFTDHQCKKCEERLVEILDSIIDDRVVKLLGVELNQN
jgi:hypothetical protein